VAQIIIVHGVVYLEYLPQKYLAKNMKDRIRRPGGVNESQLKFLNKTWSIS
jgi:hypothetical protein